MATQNQSRLERQLRVKQDKLRWKCPAKCLKFKTTDDIRLPEATPGDGRHDIFGQDRAVAALALGLEIEATGYNIFVTGPVGTGRTTTVRQMLARYENEKRELDDKCYVNNFKDPDQPMLLRFPAGQGARFRREMNDLVDALVKNLPGQFEAESYQRARASIVDSFKEQGGAQVREFEKKVAAEGFALVQTAPFVKPDLAPIVEKQPVSIDALPALVEAGKVTAERAAELKELHQTLTEELTRIFKGIRDSEREAREALEQLDRKVVEPLLAGLLNDIAERHPGDKARHYLDDVRESVLGNIDLFRQPPKDKPQNAPDFDPYLEYRVNVLVDNGRTKGAPVVFETNPSYKNLFGGIEFAWNRTGQSRTDFTRIKAGSILRADHGFLVLNALDALAEPNVWPALKRTLRNRRLEISADGGPFAMFATATLKPERVAINLKVVLIGDPYVYSLIAQYDEDFRKVFTVRADFDWVMDLNDDTIDQYCRVIKTLCEREKLLPFAKSGVGRVLEYGVRQAGRQNKLSTRFNVIGEVLKEASYWAKKDGSKHVTTGHVSRAIEHRRDRVRLQEEKLQELIDDGIVFIATKGARVGQVNGLAVYDTGEYMFGKPSRITAKTGVGSSGIINIEREAQLSGPTHDKGVYILTGYLRDRFARQGPVVMSASITFEQSYGGVDGDSASSTEVYALLSELSGLPIRQDFAVTGSVNQHGEVQPIGGVNQKIEGFFQVCQSRGLTGTQGVVIPKSNLGDLMLRPEVAEAVKAGKFHVYSVETIEQGIELLTGVAAGKPGRTGKYPAKTVYGRVRARLDEMADAYRQFNADVEERAPKNKPKKLGMDRGRKGRKPKKDGRAGR